MRDSPAATGPAAPLAPGERPTLKTISRLTGLAIATVSRALHDAPDIGQDTKRRVQETAALIGYRPNRAGVRLRTGKTNVISLVLCTQHDQMNHTARLIASVASALRQTPYHLIVTPYFAGEDPMVPVRYIVETQSADAVILNQIQPRDPRVAWLMERNFPFATHGRTEWHADHPWFDFDNTRFGEIGIELMAARGRRRIVMVAPPMGQNYARNMAEGAARRAADLGVGFRLAEGVTSDDGIAGAEAGMARLLTEAADTDGVISGSTTACLGIVAAIEDSGRVLGRDIDLYSKEGVPFLKRFRRDILTVSEDISTAGVFLARAAIQRIAEPGCAPMQALEVPRV